MFYAREQQFLLNLKMFSNLYRKNKALELFIVYFGLLSEMEKELAAKDYESCTENYVLCFVIILNKYYYWKYALGVLYILQL